MEQLQCSKWPDQEAPEDSSVLLELHQNTEELRLKTPGTVLVHCSAGVGRTGAFIALYKLINDFNKKVGKHVLSFVFIERF